jgi:2-polyprenyl-6-methoxyphenol hydroxylase-like FAD-dependent oxidoreductase
MSVGTVLICGAGVAGPTLAYWLNRSGFEATLVEHAPSVRTGGYVIDFWGLGYHIAVAMGLADDLERCGYHIREMRVVGDDGRRRARLATRVFDELTGGRYITIARSDLSRLLIERAKLTTDVHFGDSIEALSEDTDGVAVTFAHASPRRFDLVIGADGLHSAVRRLAFGPQEQFEQSLGYTVAAFETSGYKPREDDVYIVHNVPGRMLGRVALRDDRTLFLFVFADRHEGTMTPIDVAAQKVALQQRYGGDGWETSRILDALRDTDNLYYDRVSQIRMPHWSKGRIALVGDAACCVSLMAGQGSALAMTAAFALAGALKRSESRYREAFERYESLLQPFIATKQKAAVSFSSSLAPKTALGIALRNLIISATSVPGVARLTFGRDLVDKLVLPDYDLH